MEGAARHGAAYDLEALDLEPGCHVLRRGRWRRSGGSAHPELLSMLFATTGGGHRGQGPTVLTPGGIRST